MIADDKDYDIEKEVSGDRYFNFFTLLPDYCNPNNDWTVPSQGSTLELTTTSSLADCQEWFKARMDTGKSKLRVRTKVQMECSFFVQFVYTNDVPETVTVRTAERTVRVLPDDCSLQTFTFKEPEN